MNNPVAAIEQAKVLDSPSEAVTTAASKVLHQGPVKDTLTGSWLGHPLHPVLTDLPVGMWMSALLLDVLGGKSARKAADSLIGWGVLCAIPTAATGVADWVDTIEEERRVGFVHAIGNVTSLLLYTRSYLARRRGSRNEGLVLSLLGAGSLTLAAYLGGHLSYRLGAGVDRTRFDEAPDDWTPVMPAAELPERVPSVADAGGTAVLLYRDGSDIYAIADKCSHRGGPLHEGEIDPSAHTVTCPWHGSRFKLKSGKIVRGPATAPQPLWEARIVGDEVEVRRTTGA
jgi:nitrite reductase/ring-hydroxylating ferredoxin subunit/uncharacterized membrane protein